MYEKIEKLLSENLGPNLIMYSRAFILKNVFNLEYARNLLDLLPEEIEYKDMIYFYTLLLFQLPSEGLDNLTQFRSEFEGVKETSELKHLILPVANNYRYLIYNLLGIKVTSILKTHIKIHAGEYLCIRKLIQSPLTNSLPSSTLYNDKNINISEVVKNSDELVLRFKCGEEQNTIYCNNNYLITSVNKNSSLYTEEGIFMILKLLVFDSVRLKETHYF